MIEPNTRVSITTRENMLVDSHCHLDRLALEKTGKSLDTVIDEAKSRGVDYMLCVGIDMKNADTVKNIAGSYSNVYASVGVHPLDIETATDRETLLFQANHPKVVAIGETGLDYHYSTETKALQRESLIMHLEVAKELALPVIIHTREAKEDTLQLLEAHACKQSAGVLHCFTEDQDMALRAIELGFYISFSGIVTFKNAESLQAVAKTIPLERMLVETDSPYLTPVPFRGKPNFPAHTRDVAEFIADLRGISLETLASETTRNFFTLFNRASSR